MNAVSEIQPTSAPSACGTPGGLLRQEREQRGLTVQQVSEELLLDAWLIEALEENRFRALGAPVYAKGHLRKYAVLLGLPPDLILARYQVIAEPPPPLQLPPREALLTTDSIPRGFDWRRIRWPRIDWSRVDWRACAIIAGVLLLSSSFFLLAYQLHTASVREQSASASRVASATLPSEPEATQAAPTTQAPTQAGSPDRATASTASNATKTAAALPTQPSTAAHTTGAVRPPAARRDATVSAASSKAALPNTADSKTLAPKLAAGQSPGATKPTSAVVTPRTAAQPELLPSATEEPIAQVSLRLEFAVASWAEVYDADGRRLLYSQGDPARPRTVSGKPPLKVTLGMAGSVQARVNGRPIAIPRRIGQDSASFTVGSNGAIR